MKQQQIETLVKQRKVHFSESKHDVLTIPNKIDLLEAGLLTELWYKHGEQVKMKNDAISEFISWINQQQKKGYDPTLLEAKTALNQPKPSDLQDDHLVELKTKVHSELIAHAKKKSEYLTDTQNMTKIKETIKQALTQDIEVSIKTQLYKKAINIAKQLYNKKRLLEVQPSLSQLENNLKALQLESDKKKIDEMATIIDSANKHLQQGLIKEACDGYKDALIIWSNLYNEETVPRFYLKEILEQRFCRLQREFSLLEKHKAIRPEDIIDSMVYKACIKGVLTEKYINRIKQALIPYLEMQWVNIQKQPQVKLVNTMAETLQPKIKQVYKYSFFPSPSLKVRNSKKEMLISELKTAVDSFIKENPSDYCQLYLGSPS